jgi:hypothetical protein
MATRRLPVWLYVAAAVFLVIVGVLVASSLLRPDVAMYAPTSFVERPAGGRLVRDTVTLDARHPSDWQFFDFDRQTTVGATDGDWDLAARRFHIVVNGGDSFGGTGGALALARPWETVDEAPADGYEGTRGELWNEATNPVIARWYEYSFFAHTLEPLPFTYVIRTADGRYAKIRILSYYCPEAMTGCLTFEYAYQGDGSRRLTP